ncbi:MAG: hypothetical protein WCC92_06295 [Candidatus Korobacteraceae bacterium]
MPEIGGPNIEVAHHLNEQEKHRAPHPSRTVEMLEIVEAIVLALVAVTTAWSGYQAAQWDGRQDNLYEQSTKLRVQAQGQQMRGDQERVYDALTFADWLKASVSGEQKIAQLFERRFRPAFRVAFEAWKKTDPFNNPNAPPGPQIMPEYHNAELEASVKLGNQASEFFEQGSKAREISDGYVRVTVLLATVLLLTAIGQRFHTASVRIAITVLAAALILIPLVRIITLPRI